VLVSWMAISLPYRRHCQLVAEPRSVCHTPVMNTSTPTCSGLRTVGDGLANSGISQPTIVANKQGSWLTIMANRPTSIATSLQTTCRTNRHCK
jgi:hypothetical protein